MKNKLLLPFGLIMAALLSLCCRKASHTSLPPIEDTREKWDQFSKGADLSFVNQIQDNGGVYRDSGKIKDPYLIFKQHGANTVR